jgi:hypothetical protein
VSSASSVSKPLQCPPRPQCQSLSSVLRVLSVKATPVSSASSVSKSVLLVFSVKATPVSSASSVSKPLQCPPRPQCQSHPSVLCVFPSVSKSPQCPPRLQCPVSSASQCQSLSSVLRVLRVKTSPVSKKNSVYPTTFNFSVKTENWAGAHPKNSPSTSRGISF